MWTPEGLETCDNVNVEDQLKEIYWDEREEQTSQ